MATGSPLAVDPHVSSESGLLTPRDPDAFLPSRLALTRRA
jgi:hypothetical protein